MKLTGEVLYFVIECMQTYFCLFLAPPRLRLRAAADVEMASTGMLPSPAPARYDTT